MMLCLLILLPYFAFVFNFLNPHNIIDTMAGAVLKAVKKGGLCSFPDRYSAQAVKGIEQLSDVASSSIENKDKVVCMHAINSMGKLVENYLRVKKQFNSTWFIMASHIKENPDFLSMQEGIIADIEHKKYWFEMKMLRQYQMLYGESLNRMRDINYLIAINTRTIAELAIKTGNDSILDLAVKFFNTYMRATINAKDVRTAYNVFNQYKLLGKAALKAKKDKTAISISNWFKYYGQLGFETGLPFVLETAAYDLCDLNEMAFNLNADCANEILDVFLDVDKKAEEGHAMEASLRGVRKAQIKLATFYLTNNDENRAKIIFEDMRDELPSRLKSIHGELAGIESEEFWEISDRGINFDYLDAKRRKALETYFSWFKMS
jgi:hypothetical protein